MMKFHLVLRTDELSVPKLRSVRAAFANRVSNRQQANNSTRVGGERA